MHPARPGNLGDLGGVDRYGRPRTTGRWSLDGGDPIGLRGGGTEHS